MIGRTIGKYRIVGQLGRGGTGIVYKAVDETLNRDVAIKVLNPDLADTDIMTRFRGEATILAKLNHPEIATIYELVRSETDLLMVMEFVRGETLDKLSDRLGPMPPDRAAYLIDRVLSGLEHAHRAGIVHRDMKPANVMVTRLGGVKIMDFGIARVRDADHMTVDGCMMGTPAYMPPEQVLSEDVDGRADLYSVGVVFYRLLTGALPFKADTAIGMLQKQISEAPAPLHVHREDLPDWCGTILQRALAKSPADRFQTAADFRDALGRATGMMTMNLAKAFADVESEITPPPHPAAPETLAISRSDAAVPLSPGDVSASQKAPRTSASFPAAGPAGRKKRSAWAASMLAVLAASAAVLAYVGLRQPATELMTAATLPPLVFETKALVGTGSRQREPDAQLLLADGKVTVMADDDVQHPLYSVRYESVISISYSRGPDPMWNSPKGPALVARVRGGTLGNLGIFPERHWISLRTDTDRFIVLRFSGALVKRVLSALEERTGRTPVRIF